MKAILKHGGSYSVFNKIFHIGKPVSVTKEEWAYLSGLKNTAGAELFRSTEGSEEATVSYQEMTVDELKAKLTGLNVKFNINSNKKNLIKILESSVADTDGDVAI